MSTGCRIARTAILGLCALGAGLAAQVPVALPRPGSESAAPGDVSRRLDVARQALVREDPLAALVAWREVRVVAPATAEALVGLGRVHLLRSDAHLALRYAEAALAVAPAMQPAQALRVHALLRLRRFELALERSKDALRHAADPAAELLAAHASALFRLQRNDEAALVYRQVLAVDPLHAEAHLRLGSGLSAPQELGLPAPLLQGLTAHRQKNPEAALRRYRETLAAVPGHAIAHRLLGEMLYAQQGARTMAAEANEFRDLAALLPVPDLERNAAELFLPGVFALAPERRAVALRAIGLFATQVPRLVAIGGRHDLLREEERTTDALSRRSLRGKRTFDGRVWDDVRGMGGLVAATGIEALDEAALHGFDTLAHEVAHQVHLYVFAPADRRRIHDLYREALANGRCLDYYAASNEAEYFGQGVEAFASLAKRPGCESTHGHTRFELYRVDPALHDFLARVVAVDLLRDEARRDAILAAAIAVALRCGRAEDAVVAAEFMGPGPERERLLAITRRASLLARVY